MTNQPADKLRDRDMVATIWKNPTANGHFYAVELTLTYEKDGELHNSHSVPEDKALRASRLYGKAYDRILELRQADRAELAEAS